MTKKQAIRMLYSWDHQFVSVKAAQEVCDALGVKPYPATIAMDTRSQFKGLTLAGKREGDVAAGYAADSLAEHISRELGTGFVPFAMGRGTALRTAVRAIEEHLGLVKKAGRTT